MSKNYPVTLQQSKNDCGVACLNMIFNYHGVKVSYEKLKKLTKTTDKGTNALNLINASRKIGFEAKGLAGELESITTFPIIAHTIINDNFSHFVVIYEVDYKTNSILVADPDKGIIKMKITEFLNQSTKIYISIIKKNKIKIRDNRFYQSIIKIALQNKKIIIKGLILTVIVISLSLIQSMFLKKMLEIININNLLILTGTTFLSISIIKNSIEYFKNKTMDNLSVGIDSKINNDMYNHLFRLPYQYLIKKQEGEIFSIINDISDFKDSVNRILVTIVLDSLMIIATLIFLSFINVFFVILCLLLSLFLYLITYKYKNKFYQMFLMIKNKSIMVAAYLIETLGAISTIKNLNIYEKIIVNLKNKHIVYLNDIKEYNYTFNNYNLSKNIVSDLIFIISIFVACVLVNKKTMTIYDVILFESVFNIFSGSLNSVLDAIVFSKNYEVGINKVLDLYDIKEEKRNSNKIVSCRKITINNLSFKYDDKEIFNNLNLTINKGDKILLTGLSGSGKTTFINILMKYINNYQGKVLFDENDIKKTDSYSIRDIIGYVSQNEKLFCDSIYNNLVICDKYKSNLDEVLMITKVKEILRGKNIDLNYYIDQSSSNFSSGEKKRMILARTLLKNNSILILDEVFNEIDINMEKEILTSLIKMYQNKIVIVITHRLDNKELFNKYWRIENKKIIEGE